VKFGTEERTEGPTEGPIRLRGFSAAAELLVYVFRQARSLSLCHRPFAERRPIKRRGHYAIKAVISGQDAAAAAAAATGDDDDASVIREIGVVLATRIIDVLAGH